MAKIGDDSQVSSTSFTVGRRPQSVGDGSLEIRVLTLNCWGIKLLSSDRQFRIQKIAQALATDEYDLVGLQEIWSENDFELIRQTVKESLPYAHYFHSGVIGSGVCVLSRWRIDECLMHRFSLNGYAHHFHRGDWFGGKVVGLAKITVLPANDSRRLPVHVNFYSTHIHAEYNRENDNYLPHRIVQSFELSQFIRCTSENADMVLVTGDLNFEPQDLGYRIVLGNAQLQDAWLAASDGCSKNFAEETTCNRPENKYTPAVELVGYPLGKRIDYILFRNGNLTKSSVQNCDVRLTGIPNSDCSYSDHAAVCARIQVEVDLAASKPRLSVDDDQEQLQRRELLRDVIMPEALDAIRTGARNLAFDRRVYCAAVAALLVVLFFIFDIEFHYPTLAPAAVFCRFALTLIIGFAIWHGVIGMKMEEKALKNAAVSMEWLLAKE